MRSAEMPIPVSREEALQRIEPWHSSWRPQYDLLNSSRFARDRRFGPDLQEMRNIHLRLKPTPWIASDGGRGDR